MHGHIIANSELHSTVTQTDALPNGNIADNVMMYT